MVRGAFGTENESGRLNRPAQGWNLRIFAGSHLLDNGEILGGQIVAIVRVHDQAKPVLSKVLAKGWIRRQSSDLTCQAFGIPGLEYDTTSSALHNALRLAAHPKDDGAFHDHRLKHLRWNHKLE
jgi:hypothetical protein